MWENFGASFFFVFVFLFSFVSLSLMLPLQVQDLGHLETGRETQHLEAGAQVSLPLWLSKVLNLENVVSVELPVVYGKNFCSIMSADPRAVNLGPHAHWYEVGVKGKLNLLFCIVSAAFAFSYDASNTLNSGQKPGGRKGAGTNCGYFVAGLFPPIC